MTEENKELLEELTHDRMEEVMRLEADNEAGKIAFNEVATLLKQHSEFARIENETRELEAKIEQDRLTAEFKKAELAAKIEQDRLTAELKKAELEAAVKESELKIAQERKSFWLKVIEIGSAVGIGVFVMPKIKLRNNIQLAQTFAALEKEDYYNGTPYKSLKGLFRFD